MITNFQNGEVYKCSKSFGKFVLVFMDIIDGEAYYSMLHFDQHVDDTLFSPNFQHGKDGKYMFTFRELYNQWGAAYWEKINACAGIIPEGYKFVCEYYNYGSCYE